MESYIVPPDLLPRLRGLPNDLIHGILRLVQLQVQATRYYGIAVGRDQQDSPIQLSFLLATENNGSDSQTNIRAGIIRLITLLDARDNSGYDDLEQDENRAIPSILQSNPFRDLPPELAQTIRSFMLDQVRHSRNCAVSFQDGYVFLEVLL